MKTAAVPRWAVSFADLGLLLLGCFVMLHAIEAARPDAGGAVEAAAIPNPPASYRAADLFRRGDARLTESARQRLHQDADRLGNVPLRIVSRGTAEGNQRLDRFELAAARTAAVARALKGAGIDDANLSLTVAEASEPTQGQTLAIVRR